MEIDAMANPPRFPIKKLLPMDQQMFDQIDAWRAKQNPIPSFLDAVRSLIASGIASDSDRGATSATQPE